MDLATLVTFPEGTLCHGGVHLQHRPSIPTLLHYYIGHDRASTARSSVDNLPLLARL